MPSAAELAVELAKEIERLKILAMAKECKDLQEFIDKLTVLCNKSK